MNDSAVCRRSGLWNPFQAAYDAAQSAAS